MATLPSLNRWWSATRVTGGEPCVNFVLEVINQARSATMIERTLSDHAPLRQRRPADANIQGCFPSPQSRLFGDHSVHPGDRDSLDAKMQRCPYLVWLYNGPTFLTGLQNMGWIRPMLRKKPGSSR
jgi:hypothetical protein